MKRRAPHDIKFGKHSKRSTPNDQDEHIFELQYAKTKNVGKRRHLMPVKTREGKLIKREVLQNNVDTNSQNTADSDVISNTADATRCQKSAAQILADRREYMAEMRTVIGLSCRKIVEDPQQNHALFRHLLDSTDSRLPHGGVVAVWKLATISLLEVFKHVLPAYRLHAHQPAAPGDGTRLRKETVRLEAFENQLVAAYKLYLVKIEYAARTHLSDADHSNQALRSYGTLCLRCLCECLKHFFNFNFASNIVQVLVPYLNRTQSLRDLVSDAFRSVFSDDKRSEISLQIVRCIQRFVKTIDYECRPSVIDIFLHLRVSDVTAQTAEDSGCARANTTVNSAPVSRRDKKREKRLRMLKREMMVAQAEESLQMRSRTQTEIVTAVFTVYFSVLRNRPSSTLMSSVLQGLARFYHLINIDFFLDLLKSFHYLLDSNALTTSSDVIYCLQTVFLVLSGRGESLLVDPQRFYKQCYRILPSLTLVTDISHSRALLDTLSLMLLKRHRKVAADRMSAFVTRITWLCTQLPHDVTCGLLALLISLFQICPYLKRLVELDTSCSTMYLPTLDDCDYCGAQNAYLWQLFLLKRSYNAAVSDMAVYIGSQGHIKGNIFLQYNLASLSSQQILDKLDTTCMNFCPTVPVPSSHESNRKQKSGPLFRHAVLSTALQNMCSSMLTGAGEYIW